MTADTVGGVWTYALELAYALQAWDVEVALATMGAPLSAAQRAEVACVPNVRVYESTYPLEWMDDPWDDVARAGEWLLRLERSLRPDVVHLNGYVHGSLPWRAPTVMVGHSCVLSWWQAVKGTGAPERYDRYREAVTAGLQAAAVVVAPSKAMLRALDQHYALPPRQQVIYNGRTVDRYAPASKQPFILAAGRMWDEAKNIAALAHVAPALHWPVLVAGDAHHPNGHEQHFSGLNVLGKLSSASLAGWMARASIYALPARYEPFGLSVLEAALAGCALVLGDLPSLREIWGEAAVFVPPDSEDALAEQINGVIDDVPLRRSLAAKARARAHKLTAQRMAAAYYTLYQELTHTDNNHAYHPVLSLPAV
jgi:glycosyltransferase involved in cell wall biosynthesis